MGENEMNYFLVCILILFAIPKLSFGRLAFEKSVLNDEISSGKDWYDFCFKFKNEGAFPVKIVSLNSSCSCTMPSLEKEIYQAGECGEIKGVFNVSNKRGLQEQEIVVNTDDISQSEIKLQLKIKISNEYEISSRLVYWAVNSKFDEKTIVLSVGHSDWKVDCAHCLKNKFLVNVAEDGDKYLIRIKPLQPNVLARDYISIKLKNKSGEIKTLTVHALVK